MNIYDILKVGKSFNCYDDAKVRPSRHSVVTITDIIPKKKWTDDQKQFVIEACEDYNFPIEEQNNLIIGTNREGKSCTFLIDTCGLPFSVEYWGPGLLDIFGKCTGNLIEYLHQGEFDYSDDEREYIIKCLSATEEINWDNTSTGNSTKVIKDILSSICEH